MNDKYNKEKLITNLEEGTYILEQTSAADGYSEVAEKMSFEITGADADVVMKNKKGAVAQSSNTNNGTNNNNNTQNSVFNLTELNTSPIKAENYQNTKDNNINNKIEFIDQPQ